MPLIETKGAASAQGFGEFLQQGPVNYIEDVFSTYLYTGTGANQSINNGVDLSTYGGLVWTKVRNTTGNHCLTDTARGRGSMLYTDGNFAADSVPAGYGISTFNTTGFGLGLSYSGTNVNTNTYASWTFRKQSKFFDVVTWTGNGSNRTISHNLGSVPGCIIVKRTDAVADWQVYHRSLANTEYLVLNTTAAKATGTTRWNSTTPTSTVFSLGTDTTVNANGGTYVAYLFAHDAGGFGLSGTDNVISCGSFTTDAGGNAAVTLGYEPQWLMIKASSTTDNWWVWDTMRGWSLNGYALLQPNTSAAESTGSSTLGYPTATGFTIAGLPPNSSTCIYIAIRRGPMKTPTSGASVFSPQVWTGNGANRTITDDGIPPDVFIAGQRTSPYPDGPTWWNKLAGQDKYLISSSTAAEQPTGDSLNTASNAFLQNGIALGANVNQSNTNYATSSTYVGWFMRRAPGFFDVVCYTGTGSATTISHNLGVAPELIITKQRSAAGEGWGTGTQFGTTYKYLLVNSNAAATTRTAAGDNFYRTVSATNYDIGIAATLNTSGATYVAYLFATCAGVSKVGTYTGTGALQTINCGFTGGARFVLIKRTDSTGDWYVYDSARGISSGNDPYLLLNSTAAEVTGTNYVDTDSTGFKVTAAAPAGLNANGGSFVFLAIA